MSNEKNRPDQQRPQNPADHQKQRQDQGKPGNQPKFDPKNNPNKDRK